MTEEQKAWIDSASHEQLLSKWRFAPLGDPMFQGESGDYYAEALAKKRTEDPERHVRASKSIGWGKS
jgi:hypothetical protein